MWLKSDEADTWININHVTHFTIEQYYDPYSGIYPDLYEVSAHLNMAITKLSPDFAAYGGNPPTPYTEAYDICVFRGTEEECQTYVTEKTALQQAYHWLSHLVAGLLGGLIIYLLK